VCEYRDECVQVDHSKFTDAKPELEVPQNVPCDDFEVHKVPHHVTVSEENDDIPCVTDNGHNAESILTDDLQVYSHYLKRQCEKPKYLEDDLDDSTVCNND